MNTTDLSPLRLPAPLATVRRRVGVVFTVAASLLAWCQPASAKLVSRDVNVTLNAANLDSYSLDLNLDGTTDFTFQAAYSPDPVLTVGFDQITFPFGSNNGAVIDTATGDGFPPVSLLAIGNTVSAARLFSTSNDTADLYFYDTIDPTTGNFRGRTGYVGLRFAGAGGAIFYGYAQVTVNALNAAVNPFGLTIGRVAYQDVAGQPAQIVPEPSDLALTALGLLGGLGLWRRRATRA